jgi:hypothetical protein
MHAPQLREATQSMTSRATTLAQPAQTRSAATAQAWWLALIALTVILLAPLLIVDVPPLLDYPNHLARAFVLASLPQDPVIARFYAPHWSIIPNLGLDLITPPLIRILPVHVAGRLLIAAALLLPVAGTIAYNTALGGRWWSLGVGLFAYNACLLYGFLNFEIAIGLALLLAAAWLRWRESHPARTIVIAAAGAPILFACHLMGLIFFALLIGGAELCQLRHAQIWRAIVTRGAILLLIFVVPLALYAVSALQQMGGDAEYKPIGEKLLQLVTGFANYNWPLDVMTATLAVAIPALCLLTHRGRVPGPAACTSVLLLIAFLAAPYAWKGTAALDARFAIMLGFMLFAGFVPIHWSPLFRRVAIAALGFCFLARMALLTAAWVDRRTDLADLRAVLAPVQPGQAVYFVRAGLDEAPSYWRANPHFRKLSDGVRTDEHLGALALIEHRAYWPFEFDNPSQQPIETREPYAALAVRVGSIPTRAIAASANVCGFDYVLLIDADAVPPLPPDRFQLMRQSGFATLYTIRHCQKDPDANGLSPRNR